MGVGGRGDAMRGPDPKLTTDRLEYLRPIPGSRNPLFVCNGAESMVDKYREFKVSIALDFLRYCTEMVELQRHRYIERGHIYI